MATSKAQIDYHVNYDPIKGKLTYGRRYFNTDKFGQDMCYRYKGEFYLDIEGAVCSARSVAWRRMGGTGRSKFVSDNKHDLRFVNLMQDISKTQPKPKEKIKIDIQTRCEVMPVYDFNTWAEKAKIGHSIIIWIGAWERNEKLKNLETHISKYRDMVIRFTDNKWICERI